VQARGAAQFSEPPLVLDAAVLNVQPLCRYAVLVRQTVVVLTVLPDQFLDGLAVLVGQPLCRYAVLIRQTVVVLTVLPDQLLCRFAVLVRQPLCRLPRLTQQLFFLVLVLTDLVLEHTDLVMGAPLLDVILAPEHNQLVVLVAPRCEMPVKSRESRVPEAGVTLALEPVPQIAHFQTRRSTARRFIFSSTDARPIFFFWKKK